MLPFFSSRHLTVALCAWERPCEIFLFYNSMSNGVVTVRAFFRQPYCYSTMREASLSFLGDTFSKQTYWSLGSYAISTPSSVMNPETQVQELCC